MITTRTIAANLAKHLSTERWMPDGIEAPLVYLDAITTELDLSKRPAVVVVPKNSTGLWKSTPNHQIDVVLALDASSFVANAAQSAETPEGVNVIGAGFFLDSVLRHLLNTIKQALPGAILQDLGVEYSLDTLPVQFATISLTYTENPAYKDFCAFGDE